MKTGDLVRFKSYASDLPVFQDANGMRYNWNRDEHFAFIYAVPPITGSRIWLFLPCATGHSLNGQMPREFSNRGWYAYADEIEVIGHSENKKKLFENTS